MEPVREKKGEKRAMRTKEITIKDLYEGAYLLCQGCRLKELTVMGSQGKKIVTFTFAGENVEEVSGEYRVGRARVNVALLKFSMKHLKDRMFEKIREREKKENTKCSDLQKREKSRELTGSKMS
jgi:hypothetical protein